MTQERHMLPTVADVAQALDERRVRRVVLTGAGGFAAVLVAFWAWWPAGVALGLVAGTLVVFHLGRAMQEAALAEPSTPFVAMTGEDELQQEFARLRARLGDDWPRFSRAVALVTQAQWASVAGLQRELRLTTGSAQHLMGLLEREGFVGPSRGTRPRVVRVPRERAAELERLLRS
jgi:DNA segregation ATPase FtsK/SpoIIIE-like protein